MKISFLFVGQMLVSMVAVIVALYILDLKYLIENLQLISTIGIFTALVLNLLSIYLMAWRWFWIEQGIRLNGSSNSVFTYFVASIYNLISPGNLGGDVYRFIALKSVSLTPLVLTGKIFRERLAGLGSICLVGFVSLLLSSKDSFVYPDYYHLFLVASFLVSFIVLVFFFTPSFFINLFKPFFSLHNFKNFDNYFSGLKGGLKSNLSVLLISVVAFLVWVASVFVISNSMGMNIPFYVFVLVGSLVEVIRFVPISIQGIGIREASFAFFLTSYSLEIEASYALGLVSYALLSLSLFVIGILGLVALIIRKKKTHKLN